MKIYLQGSIAFDEVSSFPGKFADVIKPDLINKLSVSFVVFDKSRFFGGCAGNIAYSLGLLKTKAKICTLIGSDGADYISAMNKWGMETANLKIVEGHTALAFITSDLDQNQIAHFAPGVLAYGEKFELPNDAAPGDIILISPENHDRMIDSVNQGKDRGLKVFFDPGQLIHAFSKSEILDILEKIDALFVNEYEYEFLKKISGMSTSELAAGVPLIFVTMGAAGVEIFENGVSKKLEAYEATMVDPTGAGDAFRAGVLAGLSRNLAIEVCAKIGMLMGALSIQHKQCQGHVITDSAALELKKLGFEL